MQQSAVKSQKFKELKQQLGLNTDERELLRCNGRLQNATIPFYAKFSIFLPSDHYLTVLIIQECHKRVLHNRVRETLIELSFNLSLPLPPSYTFCIHVRCA